MRWITLFLVILICTGCGSKNIEPYTEVVMNPGMIIEATNKNGHVRISYAGQTKREYEFDGERQVVALFPRKERWYGSLGLYNPADSIALFTFRTRVVCEEGQQHFSTVEEALEWLKSQKPFSWVYTEDGLVVGFFRSPERKQVNIEVWQLYVGGKFLSQFQESDFHRMSDFNYDYKKFPQKVDSQQRIVYLGGVKPSGLSGADNKSITVKIDGITGVR